MVLSSYDEQLINEHKDENPELQNLEINSTSEIVTDIPNLTKHTCIKNGNLIGRVTYENVQFLARNTCPLDSIYELVIFALQKRSSFEKLLDCALEVEDTLNILKSIIVYIANRCSIDFIYSERMRIMLKIQDQKEYDNENKILNCAYSVTRLFSTIINSVSTNVKKNHVS